jgi:hypothetical protein
MLGDNQAALAMAMNTYPYEWTKIFYISYHYIPDLNSKEKITVKYGTTIEIVAVSIAEPIVRIVLEGFRRKLGIAVRNKMSKHWSRLVLLERVDKVV